MRCQFTLYLHSGARGNGISARVAGHFLPELCARCTILGGAVDKLLVRRIRITLSPQSLAKNAHNLCFAAGGSHRNRLIRQCIFNCCSCALWYLNSRTVWAPPPKCPSHPPSHHKFATPNSGTRSTAGELPPFHLKQDHILNERAARCGDSMMTGGETTVVHKVWAIAEH